MRLGLKCKVQAEHTMKGVLAVPKECVKWEGTDAKCKVLSESMARLSSEKTVWSGHPTTR